MSWRLAKSLETLRAQLNQRYPRRDRKSDGTIGDQAHSSRTSDHNIDSKGRVCAFDITRDPANGPDLAKMIPLLLADARCKYVIYQAKIYNPSINGGAARPYTGANAHKQHLHLSVNQAGADDPASWVLPGAPLATSVEKPPAPEPKPRQVLKKGMTGGDVPVLQLRLKELGYYSGLVDGDFGPATLKSLQKAQEALGLKVDGVCGPATWKALSAATGQPGVPEQTKNWPLEAIKLYETLGWSKLQSVALVANLVWESGGNQKKPYTINFQAHGDKDKNGLHRSHGAGQWNDTPKVQRFQLLEAFATKRGKTWTDPETQLLFLDHELHTTERKAGVALRAATTIEDAVTAAIQVWRPSVPHADRRLAIARTLLA
jgi:hypothetical protein